MPRSSEPVTSKLDGDVGQQRCADADEDVGTEAGRLSRDLALESDRAAEDDGERELEEKIDAERRDELGYVRNRGGKEDSATPAR
jgi:hypothetical protein